MREVSPIVSPGEAGRRLRLKKLHAPKLAPDSPTGKSALQVAPVFQPARAQPLHPPTGKSALHVAPVFQPTGEPFTTASRPIPAAEIAYRWPQTDLIARAIGGTNRFLNHPGASFRITGSTKVRLVNDGAELPFENQGQLEIGSGALIPSAR